MSVEHDIWSHWLLETRAGGDEKLAALFVEQLTGVRDRVLRNGAIREGDTVLDVGCGDGLIAFGALEKVGSHGRVIFSDISRPLLEQCERLAKRAGLDDRCRFVEARATELTSIEDASVDVVTMRSVLIYVDDKPAAFREFYRVLKPGGRLSLFEPINRFNETFCPGQYWGGGIPGVEDVAQRLTDFYRALQPLDTDPMMDFDEKDLLRRCEAAGFRRLHLNFRVDVEPAPPMPWELAIRVVGNPRIPSLGDAMKNVFTPEEAARFESRARPAVESGGRTIYSATAYLHATKPEVDMT